MEIVLFWLILAGLVGVFASSKGRSGFGFFLVSALLSPLVGFIIVLVLKNEIKVAEEEKQRREDQQRQEQLRREEHERQLESIRAIAAKPATATPTAAAAPVVSVADELRKLVELRDQGVLNEDEFQSQKKAILG